MSPTAAPSADARALRRELLRLAARAMDLAPEELRRAVPAVVFQVAFVGAVAIAKSAAAALVVSRTSPRTLPALYVVSAFITALSSVVFASRENHAPTRSMAFWALGLSTCSLAVYLPGAAAGFAACTLYVAADAFATLNQVRFWARTGELFELRASRRLFSLIAAASMVGSVLGGALTRLGSPFLGAPGLGIAAGLVALACWPLGRWLDNSGPVKPRPRQAPEPVLTPRQVVDEPLVRTTAALVALGSVLTVCVDLHFRSRAAGSTDEAGLAALFGAINVGSGALTAMFQLVLARPLLERLGIFPFLGMVPAGCFGLALVALWSDALWPVVALKVVESAGSLSLTPLGVQLLYGPLEETLRGPARTTVDGLVKKAGLGLGGLVLLLAGAALDPWIPAAIAVVSVLLLVLLSPLHRAYVAELGQRLARNRWNADISLDAQARRHLRGALLNPNESVVLASLELLHPYPAELKPPLLQALLAHPSERVQERGLELIAELEVVALLEEVRRGLHSPRRRVREEAVRTLARLSPSTAPRELRPLLEHPDPGTRGAAAVALWQHPPTRAVAEAVLVRMQRPDATAPERRELAHALGGVDRGWAEAGLKHLLDDPQPSVRAIAYGSVARQGMSDWAPVLLERLGRRTDRAAARRALASFGDEVLPLLGAALNDRKLPIGLRHELPRVLREMASEGAADVLLKSNVRDAASLRLRIGQALSSMRVRHPELRVDASWTEEAIARRLDALETWAPVFQTLRAVLPERDLLIRALGERLDQSLELAFRLLGLLGQHAVVMDAHHGLRRGGSKEREVAAELVEHLVPDRRLARRFAEVIDLHHRVRPPEASIGLVEALTALMGSQEPLIRFLARRVAAEQGFTIPATPNGEEGEMSDARVETMLLLEGVELFAHCGVDALGMLAGMARDLRLQPGEVLFRRGDPGDRFFVVMEGEVRVERLGRFVIRLGRRDAIGDISLLDGAPRPVDVTAETPLHLLAFDRAEFLDLVSDQPELLQGLLASLAGQLRRIIEGDEQVPLVPGPARPRTGAS